MNDFEFVLCLIKKCVALEKIAIQEFSSSIEMELEELEKEEKELIKEAKNRFYKKNYSWDGE